MELITFDKNKFVFVNYKNVNYTIICRTLSNYYFIVLECVCVCVCFCLSDFDGRNRLAFTVDQRIASFCSKPKVQCVIHLFFLPFFLMVNLPRGE